MKMLSNLSFLFLLFALAFTSCEKDNIDEIIHEDPVYTVDTISVNPFIVKFRTLNSDTLYIDCIRIPYPVELLQASGNTMTVNSDEELDSALVATDSIIDFVYPFEAIVNNNETTISSIEDLVLAIQICSTYEYDCADQDAHVLLFFNALNILTLNRYVYEINYPVTLLVEGNTVVINNNNEYLPAVGGSPFDLLETKLVYPITIKQFGRNIVLNSDQDVCTFYGTLDEPCQDKPAHIQFFFNEGPGTPLNCTYFIDYPVNITFNGSNIQVQSREEYKQVLNASSDAYDNITLVYPVSAFKFQGGQQITFGTDAGICQYLDNCQ